LKNVLAYYNAGVVAVNLKIEGLALVRDSWSPWKSISGSKNTSRYFLALSRRPTT
jgi:hypothetical protein